MRLSIRNIGGEVVKEDERYVVTDNKTLNNLVVSSTKLNAKMSTSGHSYKGQEEVYYFVDGSGRMELDDESISVMQGDVVLIEDGVFHRVHAGPKGCYFVCVFDERRTH